MLGKLIKYDLKASARILILIHLLYLVLCISIRLFFINRLDFNLPANVLFTPVLICAVMVFLLIFVLWFSTWLILAFRFYRNLFSGEGYLSWTQSPLLDSHILYNRFCAPVFHSGAHGCFSSHARIRKHGARHHEKLYRRYINAGRRNYSSHCCYCLCRHSLYHDKENQSALGI